MRHFGASAAAPSGGRECARRRRGRWATRGSVHSRSSLVLLLLVASPVDAQTNWDQITENIARSSLLNTAPGTTIERDVQALIFFFNNTCTAAQSDANDAANPYRGAFAQISQWRQNKGWESIVRAHSEVPVQCKALYMEGGEEFAAKHCFWNVDSLQQTVNGTLVPLYRYPDPHWSIVVECCEQLERPTLRIADAVFATTRGVGRAHRVGSQKQIDSAVGTRNGLALADDYDYVTKLDCTQAENICEAGGNCACDSLRSGVRYTPGEQQCDTDANCEPADKPIGIRSKHYFNVGLAVGEAGTLIRTFDGGYSWEAIAVPDVSEDLNSISINVRMGAFGYENVYYDLTGNTNGRILDRDGRDYTLLYLDPNGMAPAAEGKHWGLDGVWWPDDNDARAEGWAVGNGGTIVKIENAGLTGWDPLDPNNVVADPADGRIFREPNNGANAPYLGVTPPGCETNKNLNDVFFWNKHLAFFVGDQGFLCRYGFMINPDRSMLGPGQYIEAAEGEGEPEFLSLLQFNMQGADNTNLNWGTIFGNKDYMFSNFRSVFCLQIDDIDETAWVATDMQEAGAGGGITYTQHMTCFAVGTRPPDTAGTTSAILRYSSEAIAETTTDPITGTRTSTYQEDIKWEPQDARTSEPLNDIYCVKTRKLDTTQLYRFRLSGDTDTNEGLTCYAVGDNGVIRFTQNGGLPWSNRFSGVTENLRKVVIIGLTHSTDKGTGENAVVIGDNGRVLRTFDSGNKWEKLERVTPEHLISLQFNAFDDYAYAREGSDLSLDTKEYLSWSPDANHGRQLPWSNGIATGAFMYNWPSKRGVTCGLANPNTGPATNRQYDCKRPEMSVLLRTNCQSTSGSLHWRCRPECMDHEATIPVELVGTLANPTEWETFWTNRKDISERENLLDRAIVSHAPQCDEVWTVGHGTPWHEDTRETRLFESYEVDEETLVASTFEDVKAIRPAHEMCLYGWPRHLYRLHEGRRERMVTNVTSVPRTKPEYTFLTRLRHTQDECTALGGKFYAAEPNYLADCVFEFGELTSCPSWEVYGMGHTELSVKAQTDTTGLIGTTKIPFVNFSVITDPCLDDWYGITCEAHATADAFANAVDNRTITQIWLYSNNLQGAVPTRIEDLTNLRSLSLGSNKLTGEIPPTVWRNMTDLKYLSLAENSLSGAIPTPLGELPVLEELRLHGNELGGEVPTELGHLGHLQSLSLHGNRLRGRLPSELGSLSGLQYLWISTNNFTGALPSELGQLSMLRYLWFANNSLTSLPAELGELANLRSMDGTNNAIVDRLPYSIGKLSRLRVLRLGRNQIRATIPDALGMCTALSVLELQHNQLVGPVPASFGALEELTTLDLSHNLLERKLPISIEGMHSLQFLFLQDNNLEGGLPPSIGALRKLEKLNMANNLLTEPLPDELADCDRLEMIDLQNNRITGALPEGIWRLKLLEYLFLTHNHLRGPLPEGLGYLAQIREMRLDDNRIDGTIPMTTGDADTLKVLRMDANQLSGSIPSTMGKLRYVETLDLHNNRLAGSIPPEFSGLQSARKIYIHQNSLGGQIPETIGNLTSLEELRVSTNRLSGTIPPSLGSVRTLRQLALDNNVIGGSIPEELGMLSARIQRLNLQNNMLNGLLPTFFRRDAFRAVAINLAGNPFWCPLPAWPALNGTASCVHCPDDVYLEDDHRTCSDHGVCKDGIECLCDPKWEGTKCDLLRCNANDLTQPACNDRPGFAEGSTCINDFVPQTCVLDDAGANGTAAADVAAGMCQNLNDDCSAAYHECPNKGISVQVDSTGIVIAVEAKHNKIVRAICVCELSWSGNDCTMPPLPPPTNEPWPDPYSGFTLPENSAAGLSARAAARRAPVVLLSVAVAVLGAAGVVGGGR